MRPKGPSSLQWRKEYKRGGKKDPGVGIALISTDGNFRLRFGKGQFWPVCSGGPLQKLRRVPEGLNMGEHSWERGCLTICPRYLV